MTAGQQRSLQRGVHLGAALLVVAHLYLPLGGSVAGLIRWVAIPALALTGLAMWQAAPIRRALRRVRRAGVWG